jgi:endoglucanase
MTSRAASKTVQLVVYGIPNRDNGGYSSGGAKSETQYYSWVGEVASGIGSSKAIVILEPDALGLSRDLKDPVAKTARKRMLSNAVSILKKQPNAWVYIEASTWVGATEQANLLHQAGVAKADGFAINTSGFSTNASNYAYGDAVSAKAGGKHYVVDTSRNGQGPLPGQWCNPSGRGLGARPQGSPAGHPLVDALLWVKHPGDSDGACNGGPNAGTFWPDYALGLLSRANYAVQ